MKITSTELEKHEFLFGGKSEVGFVILILEPNGTYSYKGTGEIGLSCTAMFEPRVGTSLLKGLALYPDDSSVILTEINAYRGAGVDARMLTVYRDRGHSIIVEDVTSEYSRMHLIID